MPSSSLPHRLVSLVGLAMVVAAILVPLPSSSAPVPAVVVEGDYLGENGLPNRDKSRRCFEQVVGMLKAAHVPYVVTKDSRVERDGLPSAAVAIFPYNRAMTNAEAAQVCRFVDGGGKVIVFVVAHGTVLGKLGICRTGMVPAERGAITGLILQDCLSGVPDEVPWQADSATMAESEAAVRVLASWRTRSGGATPHPALLRAEAGIYATSDPRGLPAACGGELLRGLIGLLAPATWHAMLPSDPAEFGPFGRYASLAQLQAYLTTQAETREEYREALAQAREASAVLEAIGPALEAGEIERALALETKARETAEGALSGAYPSVPGELRGVWMCNYAEPSWPAAMAHLRQANFNAIFPYMMSGGVAFYRSKVLPVHPSVRTHGDFLAEAVSAAKAAGVPLHARMLNLSTIFAPPEVKASLRQAGRLMVTSKGTTSDWLCPTNPVNRQAQVAAALELADYGVAGIQFDYLRYPWKDTCFCGRCRAAFEQQHGIKVARWPADVVDGGYRGRFADWRREQVTSLVAEMSQAVRQQHPGVYVSAAVFLNWEDHRETFGQDWVAWIERGLVDFVCPMDYTADMGRFELYVSRQEKWINGKVPWAAGLGVYADGCNFTGPALAAEQIRVARQHGSQGFVIFNYSPDLVTDYLPYLCREITRHPTEFDCPPGH